MKEPEKHNAKTDIFSASKLRQELYRLKPKEEGDTNNFFEKIATIQIKTQENYG